MTTQANGTAPDLIQVNDLQMHFPVTKGIVFQRQVGAVKAVDGVSVSVRQGETLGVDRVGFVEVDRARHAAHKVIRVRVLAAEDGVDFDDLLLPFERFEVVRNTDEVDLG